MSQPICSMGLVYLSTNFPYKSKPFMLVNIPVPWSTRVLPKPSSGTCLKATNGSCPAVLGTSHHHSLGQICIYDGVGETDFALQKTILGGGFS